MSFVTSETDIAGLYEKVTTALSTLAPDAEREEQLGHEDVLEYRCRDEIQRIDIWASQHGVREGKLDYQLREASLLRGRVAALLTDLLDTSADAHNVQTDSRVPPPSQRDVEAIEHATEPPSLSQMQTDEQIEKDVTESCSVASATSSGIDTNISLGDSMPESPITRIHDTISLLFELGPTLLNPVPHDRLNHTLPIETSRFDIDHARTKFPKAKLVLIDRVARANWERRQSLRNLRLRHEASFALLVGQQTPPDRVDYEDYRDGWHKSRKHDYDQEEDSSYEGSVPSQDSSDLDFTVPVDTSSTTSKTAESIFTKVGTQSTPGTNISVPNHEFVQPDTSSGRRYKVPPPPDPNSSYCGEAFLCPYCFRTLSDIKSSSQWRQHVFDDLEPYMCTYESCTLSGKTYGNKEDWWKHEIDRHRVVKSWRCNPCERKDHDSFFNSVDVFDTHVHDHHPRICTPEQLKTIRDLCQEASDVEDPFDCCPFCQEAPLYENTISARKKNRAVMKHVSKHFEELALFVAFPAGQMILKDDDSEFMDDSDFESEVKTEIDSLISDDRRISRQEVGLANVNRFIADQRGTRTSTMQNPSQPHESGSRHLDVVQPLFPIRILLHPPNEHFYGRDSLIQEAAEVLRSPGSICVLHGVGGIGKTLAAIEYTNRSLDQFDAIFWLQADTAPSLTDSYTQMGTALGLISSTDDHLQAMERGRTWLQETAKHWLLIFDNAIAWEQISPFMPNNLRQSNGCILITTQLPDLVKDSSNITKMKLEPLDQKTGSEMLLKYLNKDIKHDPERHLAREISTFIGGLPIAIAHVAGFAEESHYSLEELIETFREWRKRTGVATDEEDDLPTPFREAASSYAETLAMVWNVTLRDLTKDAQDVMHILAYLNSEAVPTSMLFAIHEDPSLHFLDNREKMRIKRLQQSLIRRRLVVSKEVDGEWCFSIHRSLQRGIRETLAQESRKQQLVFDQTVALLREILPQANPLQQPMPDQWGEYQRLLPHLHALRDVYNKNQPHIKGSVDFAQILSDAGMDQFERGITKEGLWLLITAEEVLDALSTEDHQVLRAGIHAMIGIMYDNMGIDTRREGLRRRKIALDIRRSIVERSKQPKRNDEILLYNSWMEYAISLLHYHRFEEAEPVIESCLQKYREWGPENQIPFEYAKYYHKIALVRTYQERFNEAIEMATRGADLMSKTGYVLFETRFRFDLACILLQSGDVDGALRVHHEVFDSRLEKLGQANQLTLHSRYAIGAIYEIKGQYEEAELWLRKALNQRRGVSSWPDEAFARAQFHLSRTILLQGDHGDAAMAKQLREKSLKVLHRLLPLDHPEQLKGCQDEIALFDHMQTVQGARFTGQGLLKYFSKPTKRSS